MARPEAYAVRYDQSAYSEFQNKGLNPEEARQLLVTRLENQIASYLGEFILAVRFKEFFYEEATNPQTGQKELHAPGFIGPIAESYDRAIRESRGRGWSGERENAECEGFRKLEKALLEAPEGTLYLWISPPGSKEEGYGDYSFTHLGQVKRIGNRRRIDVTSVRNTLTLEEHQKVINHFLPEDEKLQNPEDTDFLRTPVVIQNPENRYTVHDLLVAVDVLARRGKGRQIGFAEAYHEREDWEERLRQLLTPFIDDYCSVLESGASNHQLQTIIWSLENYAVGLFKTASLAPLVIEQTSPVRPETKPAFYAHWGYEPEALRGGSCPLTSTTRSSSLTFSSAVLPFQEHQLENSHSSEGKRTLDCECPSCRRKVKAIIENETIHCPACGAAAPYKC